MTPPDPATPVEMVEMESRLRADQSGAYRDQLCQELESQLSGVKRRMDAGLSPEDFASAAAVRAALEAALTVVPLAWQAHHR